MVYITVKQPPMYHQLSLEEFLLGDIHDTALIRKNTSNTRTYCLNQAPKKFTDKLSVNHLISELAGFNKAADSLRAKDRLSLYTSFYIAKHGKGMEAMFKNTFDTQDRYIECDASKVCKGIAHAVQPLLSEHEMTEHQKMFEKAEKEYISVLKKAGFNTDKVDFNKVLKSSFRLINAPKYELKETLTGLKSILEDDFGILYHTSAFAYIKKRCTIDALKRHQANASKWYVKLDLTDFFGSTTLDYAMKMCSMIYPLSEIVKRPNGRAELEKALELGFLNGGLPQGTPLSPTLTNIIMIPIDYTLFNTLRDFENQHYTYTRYADDFLISSKYNFDFKSIENLVVGTLKKFEAPFALNREKTRYGSSAGSNWNLGLMLNKDNQITVGHENKRRLQAALTNYVLDSKNGSPWSKSEVQTLEGSRNYYRSVECENIDKIVTRINQKFNVDVVEMIKRDLHPV